MVVRVWGLEFGVWGLGFGVWGLGLGAFPVPLVQHEAQPLAGIGALACAHTMFFLLDTLNPKP